MGQDMASFPTSSFRIFGLTVPTVAAMSVNMAMSIMSIVFAIILHFYLKHLNKRLDRGEVVEDVKMRLGSREIQQEIEKQGLPPVAVDRGFRFLT